MVRVRTFMEIIFQILFTCNRIAFVSNYQIYELLWNKIETPWGGSLSTINILQMHIYIIHSSQMLWGGEQDIAQGNFTFQFPVCLSVFLEHNFGHLSGRGTKAMAAKARH